MDLILERVLLLWKYSSLVLSDTAEDSFTLVNILCIL